MDLQVTFRNVEHFSSVESYIRQRAAKLEMFSARIIACHVAIEVPHKHQQSGRHVRVRIDLTVPGGEVAVSHAPDEEPNEDVYAAVDSAFGRLARRLDDHVRRQRDNVRRGSVSGGSV